MLKTLVGKRSALDFAREELTQLKRLAPSGARNKLTIHTDAVLAAETSVSNAINALPERWAAAPAAAAARWGTGGAGGTSGNGAPTCGGGCTSVPAPPTSPVGMADPAKGFGNHYGNPTAQQDDAPIHAAAGRHTSRAEGRVRLRPDSGRDVPVVARHEPRRVRDASRHHRALRAPPAEPQDHYGAHRRVRDARRARHHRRSSCSTCTPGTSRGTPRPSPPGRTRVDGCGNNLLDFTCVPFLTEVQACSHERSNMAAMIIGGKQLGFVHDRYVTGNITDQPAVGHHRPGVRSLVDHGPVRRAARRLLDEARTLDQ